MKKIDNQNVLVEYIMEPVEELVSTRFIAVHKGVLNPNESEFWNGKSVISLTKQAEELGFQGGYKYQFHMLRGGHSE